MTNEGERIATVENQVENLTKRVEATDRKMWWGIAAVLGVVLKYAADAVQAGAGQ